MKQCIFKKDIGTVNSMLYELTCLRRWSEVTVEGGKYTELSKQALNCMIAYMWAIEVTQLGVEVDFKQFPKLAIFRGFTKTHQCDVPERNLDIIFELGNISKDNFNEMIAEQFDRSTSKAFANLIKTDYNSLEARIYRGATKIATLLELSEIKSGISLTSYTVKSEQLKENIAEYSDIPGFYQITSEEYINVFKDFAQLRNRIRWAKHPNIIKCSVLGHLFDVAVYAYMMSMEVNPMDEELATKFFFMGIFHDWAERWTGDMPSPIKDSLPGLRKATEAFENQVMEQNVYNVLPDYMVSALRDVMLEDEKNASVKVFLKKSDNFSAFIECWREIDAGSKHKYYFEVARRDFQGKEKLPDCFRLLLEELYSQIFF